MASPLRHFRLDTESANALTVWFDVADRSVNVLTDEVLDELDRLIDSWSEGAIDTPIILRSAKAKGFAAGADLKRIAAFQTVEEVDAFVQRGNDVLSRLRSLSRPTIAVVNGACLGGGLELAMSCSYRLLIDEGKPIQIGLPETQLGLIPGWGGTQLLPRLFGLAESLDTLLSGESITFAEELYGLVDDILQVPRAEEELASWVNAIVRGHPPETSVPQVRSAPEYEAIFSEKERHWISQENPDPALQAILKVVRAGWPDAIDIGLEAERKEFRQLVFSDNCRQRLKEFFASKRQ